MSAKLLAVLKTLESLKDEDSKYMRANFSGLRQASRSFGYLLGASVTVGVQTKSKKLRPRIIHNLVNPPAGTPRRNPVPIGVQQSDQVISNLRKNLSNTIAEQISRANRTESSFNPAPGIRKDLMKAGNEVAQKMRDSFSLLEPTKSGGEPLVKTGALKKAIKAKFKFQRKKRK